MNATTLQMLDPERLAAWAHADPAMPGLSAALLRALEEQLSWRAQWEPLVTLLEHEGIVTLEGLGAALGSQHNRNIRQAVARIREGGMR